MNKKWLDAITFCASAATTVQKEPPIYASLRLLEVLERMIRLGIENDFAGNDAEKEQFDSLAKKIVSCKASCMDNKEAFEAMVFEIVVELMDFQMELEN